MGYDNTGREAAAQANRRRILAVAHDAFLDNGYAGTTLRAVAQAAGVSQETLYKSFGGKAGLLKAVYDVTIAGDDSPVPVAQRQHGNAVRAAGDTAAAAAAWARMTVAIGARIKPLLGALMSAREDAAIRELIAVTEAERLAGARLVAEFWHNLGWLRPHADVEEHAITLWTLNSPEVRFLLDRQGYDDDRYTTWLEASVRALVLTAPGDDD
ncbi:TetR/AcrR family transcriptional regulator [Micromonospora aurantiaca]|uniref:TetR/AcrR family transcriptional regulator n=1 Tax=Micromonospora TaxID=1873 RepID=UPI000F3EF304|nr:helix-turn-helix domain-containing protein [Micromonospora aurantiaca]RNH98185.1 TetR/AcrR family transcriptional regulator [Micromonospora aurantiaca]